MSDEACSAIPHIGSYPKIYNLGHPEVLCLNGRPVYIEEKVDGSQFSFMVDAKGLPYVRSNGQQFPIDAPQSMFKLACETVQKLADAGKLVPGYIYRGEAITKPRHNTLKYDRIPEGGIILFDVQTPDQTVAGRSVLEVAAVELGLETVPLIGTGTMAIELMENVLDRKSVLGDTPIEGVVIKQLHSADGSSQSGYLFGRDGKIVMAKHVSEAFKETHRKAWKESNPSNKDVIMTLAEDYRSPVRWQKAVMKLREVGQITDTYQDIGPLLKFIQQDLEAECEQEIKDRLYAAARKHILRKSTAGLPEWYKEQLLKDQFVGQPES